MGNPSKLSNIVFAYDGDFKFFEGVYYSSGGFPHTNWLRYLAFSDNLIVAARASSVDARPKNAVISSIEKMSLIRVPSISGPAKLLKNYESAKKILRSAIVSADLIVVRLPSEIGLLAADLCRAMGKPYAVELVGDVKEAFRGHGSLAGKIYSPIAHGRTKKIVLHAPACIYVTEKYLQKIYPCRGVTAHASNVQLVLTEPDIVEERVRYRSGRRIGHAFGLIGSLKSDYKGVDVALKALKVLVDRGHLVTLRVLGDGDASRYIEMASMLEVSHLVSFDGTRSSPNEVYRWLDELSYYMQPSKTEGLPRSLIEAMSRGLPALGSDRGGIPELLQEDCVFQALDSIALADVMERFISMDEDEYFSRGLRNFDFSRKFEKSVLDRQRNLFWKSVLKNCC